MTDSAVQAIPDSDATGFDPDVIVVGSGSAGAAAARRLVDRGARVLLLEAGGPDVNPAIHDPGRLHELWLSEVDWAYETVPQRHASDRRLGWPRGRVLGGSSCLNAMIWVRGAREDYDNWSYGGADGWSWDDVRPVFERIERREPAADDGIVTITSGYEPTRSTGRSSPPRRRRHRVQPGLQRRRRRTASPTCSCSIKEGVRHSTARAPTSRTSPTTRTCAWSLGAQARRLLFAGTRCTGVEWSRDGRRERARAAEVVVAGGTIGSPQLLLLSGVGPAEQLRRARHRRRRRPAGRRREPARPPALARSSSALSARSGRRRPACPPARRTSSGARVLASPCPTCSRSTSWCRCTSRGWQGPRTGSP